MFSNQVQQSGLFGEKLSLRPCWNIFSIISQKWCRSGHSSVIIPFSANSINSLPAWPVSWENIRLHADFHYKGEYCEVCLNKNQKLNEYFVSTWFSTHVCTSTFDVYYIEIAKMAPLRSFRSGSETDMITALIIRPSFPTRLALYHKRWTLW